MPPLSISLLPTSSPTLTQSSSPFYIFPRMCHPYLLDSSNLISTWTSSMTSPFPLSLPHPFSPIEPSPYLFCTAIFSSQGHLSVCEFLSHWCTPNLAQCLACIKCLIMFVDWTKWTTKACPTRHWLYRDGGSLPTRSLESGGWWYAMIGAQCYKIHNICNRSLESTEERELT